MEGRIRSDYSTTKFLRILPDESKWARVHKGEALVESAQALGLKPDIAIPDGQVQHWVAAAFLPNATLDAVLPRLRNYNNRSRYMKPEIIASRLKDHHGDVFEVYLRLSKSRLSPAFSTWICKSSIEPSGTAWRRSTREARAWLKYPTLSLP